MQLWIWLLIIFLGVALGGLIRFLVRRPRSAETPFLLIQQQMDALRGELRQTLDGNTLAITEHLKNQLDLLQKNHVGVDQRLDTAGKVFRELESRMGRVEEISRQVLEVGKDISGLQQILKAPKLRGNFSEELLADLLSQMMPNDNFELQYTFQSGERVDAVIKTAQGLVAVDAKFPLENFQRLVMADGDEEKKSLRKKFIQDVKNHVDDIASKYILPAEGTFEFALMYIPAENVYYEIITRDLASAENASIVHYALRKKVIPVSPNTFYAYLQTILLGLRGMRVEKRVQEIVMELSRLRKELDNFRIDFSLIGKHLKDATSSFEKSDKRLVRLEDKLGAVEILPAKEDVGELKEKVLEERSLLEQ